MKKYLVIIATFILAFLIPIQAKAEQGNLFNSESYRSEYMKHYTDLKLKMANRNESNPQDLVELTSVMFGNMKDFDTFIRQDIDTGNFATDYFQNLKQWAGGLYSTWNANFDAVWDYFQNKTGDEIENPVVAELITDSMRVPDGYVFVSNGREYHNLYILTSIIETDYLRLNIANNSGTWERLGSYKIPYDWRSPESIALRTQVTEMQPLQRFYYIADLLNLEFYFKKNDTWEKVPSHITVNNNNYSRYIDNVKNDTTNIIPQNYEPKINVSLLCGNEIVQAKIENHQLYLMDGTLIQLNEQDQSLINNVLCDVEFKAPVVEIDENKNIIIKQDGEEDINLDEKIIEQEMPDCDGVLCWVSNIWKVAKSLVNAIVDLPIKIINALTDLLKFLFVPSADSFNGFVSELNTTMSEKFNLTAFTNVFSEMTPNQNARTMSTNSSNTFDGVMVEGLMGTGEVKIIDGDTINAMLPTLHSWIKGFFYVLLAFFNINHMYKLIRGTTIFESMRGKSE